MKPSARLLSLCPVVAVLLASTGPRDQVAFGPEEGTSLTKTFQSEGIFELDDFSAILDGQDMSAMLGSFEVSFDTSSTVSVTDTYGPSEEGRPLRLERSFETLEGEASSSMDSDMGSETDSMPLSSDLEGTTVVFAWDEEEEDYSVSFDGDGGDEELLEGLEEEMDLRFLLPEDSVSEDDTWEVPLTAFAALITPGGNLNMSSGDADGLGDFEDVLDELQSELTGDQADMLAGTAQCTYTGVREEDGAELAEIAIEIEISTSTDILDLVLGIAESVAEDSGEEMPLEFEIADLEVEIEAEGVLLWNTEAGHFHSLELSSDGYIAIDVAFGADMGGESHSAEISVEMSASMKNSVTAE